MVRFLARLQLKVTKTVVTSAMSVGPTACSSSYRGSVSMTMLEAGQPGFDSRRARDISVLTTFRPALGPTQTPFQWVLGSHFRGGKEDRTWSWPFTSTYCPDQERVELYLHTPIRLHGVMLNVPETFNITCWHIPILVKIRFARAYAHQRAENTG
jgi:hypothetical protein